MKKLAAVLAALLFPVIAGATSPFTIGPFSYDGSGNVTAIGAGEQFRYDDFGRIKTSAQPGTSQSFTYDQFGNILSVTTNGAAIQIGVDSNTNRLLSSGNYNVLGQYDGAGNLTQYNGSDTFVYDGLNAVKQSTTGGITRVYLYNAGGERIAAVALNASGSESSSEWTIRDLGAHVLRRYTRTGGTWTWKEDDVYLGGQLIAAEVDTTARTRHFFPDHLGSPRLITASGGTKVSAHTYAPFGQEITDSLQDSERLKFTGHERDNANLDYMHARYYAPFAGRFLSVDPGRDWDPKQPQSWNMYTYVSNNPMNRVDPTGRCGEKADVIGPMLPCAKAESTPKPDKQPAQAGGRTPAQGQEPGSATEFPAEGGGKTVRTYGPDGRAVSDVDYGHDHGAGDPHVHDWDWDKARPRQPGRAPNPGEIPEPSKSTTIGQQRPGLQTIIEATFLAIGGTAIMIMTGGGAALQPSAGGIVIVPHSGLGPIPTTSSDCPPSSPYCI